MLVLSFTTVLELSWLIYIACIINHLPSYLLIAFFLANKTLPLLYTALCSCWGKVVYTRHDSHVFNSSTFPAIGSNISIGDNSIDFWETFLY